MSNSKTYVNLLNDTVEKKEALLGQLILETIKQANCFQDHEFLEEKFDEIYQKKLEMLQQIDSLDEGFCSLYERVKDEMKENKYAYESEIKKLQERIRKITEKALKLQRLEQDNRQKFDAMMMNQRKKIKDYKISKKSAAAYYKNMMKQLSDESVFYNKSK